MPDDWPGQIWYTWTGNSFANGTAATIITSDPVLTVTSPATVNVDTVWTSWQRIAHDVYRRVHSPGVSFGGLGTATRTVTVEERTAHEERRRKANEKRAREEAAQYRAQVLLRSILTDGQWAAFLEVGAFTIVGSDGVTYLIEDGVSGNISALDSSGEPVVRYCVHPELWDETRRAYLPKADVLVAQTLGLRTNAEEYLRKANVHWRRRPQQHTLNFEGAGAPQPRLRDATNQEVARLRDAIRSAA